MKGRMRRVIAGGLLAGVLALLGLVHAAQAGDAGDKGLFDRVDVEPFVVTVEWPGSFISLYGVAQRDDGSFWITGSVTDLAYGGGEGYLAAINPDGLILTEQTLTVGNANLTEFWWPALLEDGRLAIAVSLDPFEPAADGGVAIVGEDGRIEAERLLSELGLDGGEVVHLNVQADGDLTIVGSAANTPSATRQALVARLDSALGLEWIATDAAPDRDYDLAGYASVVLEDGSVVAGGAASDADFIAGVGWLAAYDAGGRLEWRYWPETTPARDSAPGEGRTAVNWVTALPDSTIVHLQSAYGPSTDPTSSTLVGTTPEGEAVFEHKLDLPAGIELIALAAARNGDMLVGGIDLASDQPILARVAPDGAIRWDASFPELPGGCIWAILEAEDGSIVAVGGFDDGDDRVGGFVVGLGKDGERS